MNQVTEYLLLHTEKVDKFIEKYFKELFHLITY